jgi:N6-L-threonylcarbamoyladenine synthase
VACNGALVEAMRAEARKLQAEVFAPTPRLATDNAAMIGAAGLFRLEAGERSDASLNAFSALPIPGLQTED